ncbi:MAG: TspO/MBR family protein [Pseudomonadota bacterium]
MKASESARSLSLWLAVGLAFTTGAIGGALTPLGSWYEALQKPAFQPPDWLFGPAWTLIFLLTAYAGHRVWEAGAKRSWVLSLFGLNALLNVLWSYLFFFSQRPDLAVFEAIALWFSIAAIVFVFRRRVPVIRWLLAPYLMWVAFAFVLNAAIVRLNGPFTGT